MMQEVKNILADNTFAILVVIYVSLDQACIAD